MVDFFRVSKKQNKYMNYFWKPVSGLELPGILRLSKGRNLYNYIMN